MNFLQARWLFPQTVDLSRYSSVKTFGSVSQGNATITTAGLACSIQTAPDADVLQFGAEGAEALVAVVFPENPGALPGDELLGRGIDEGRIFTVKDCRPAPSRNLVYWICDCTERR